VSRGLAFWWRFCIASGSFGVSGFVGFVEKKTCIATGVGCGGKLISRRTYLKESAAEEEDLFPCEDESLSFLPQKLWLGCVEERICIARGVGFWRLWRVDGGLGDDGLAMGEKLGRKEFRVANLGGGGCLMGREGGRSESSACVDGVALRT
jgi:hypothetical protein